MKLTKKQIEQIKRGWGDWEEVHQLHDRFMEKRLKELDPEFIDSLKKHFKDATFWYA